MARMFVFWSAIDKPAESESARIRLAPGAPDGVTVGMRRLRDMTGAIFGDPAVRYGIKFGLAGMLAVFIALVLRLQEPTWALFTVFVLMIAQYVGAIGEKSVFRLIGTVVGGLIGYLLTGALEQTPYLYLGLVGLVVGFSTAMFGQSRYPYAFLLCGLTTVVVTSNGMADPEQSWQYMLWRVEEVTLGIIATMVVQSVLWPRFARLEFLENLRTAFGDLRACLAEACGQVLAGETVTAAERAAGFPARITQLRGLLDFGARESQHFRDRIATYFELTSCQARIASAISTLREPLPPDSIYLKKTSEEIRRIHATVDDALADLENKDSTPESRRRCRDAMTAAAAAFEERLLELRRSPEYPTVSGDQVLVLGVHYLAFAEIRKHIARAQELLDSLTRDPLSPSSDHAPILSPWPSPFWIRSGIKAGLAVIIALFLENWLNPPGATMFALGVWVFTAMNATSPGGQGDRRAFHVMPLSILALLALSLLLLAGRPLLSSYAVMNTLLFSWLFVWGYLSFRTRGVTIPMQLGMLCAVGILGLNGQEPISFQQIVDFFFGIALALVVAAVIQRLLWPSLPQWEIRDRLVELIDISRRILRDGPEALPLWQRTRLALIPGEVSVRLQYLEEPIFRAEESGHIAEILQRLVRVSGHLLVSVRRLDEKPGDAIPDLPALEADLDATLARLRVELLAKKPPAGRSDVLTAGLQALRDHALQIRRHMIEANRKPHEILEFLGLAERYRLATEDVVAVSGLITHTDTRMLNADASL